MIVLHEKFAQEPFYVAPEDVRRIQKHDARTTLVTFADGMQIEVCESAKVVYERRELALNHELVPIGNRKSEARI